MLRIPYGCAWRYPVVIALLVLIQCVSARGALIGLPPLQPLVSKPTTPPTYNAPTTYSISGYVYIDSAMKGVKLAGELGVTGVTLTLVESTTSGQTIQSLTATTNAAGYYDFTGLQTGMMYKIVETQPSAFHDSTTLNGNSSNSLGYFLSSTGGTLTAPTGPTGIPANGTQSASVANTFSSIYLPLPKTSGFGPNSQGGVYSAVNYNFGELPNTPINIGASSGIGKPPTTPGVPGNGNANTSAGTLSTALNVDGGNNRFLAGAGANSGVLSISGSVINSPPPKTTSVNWQITSLSNGLNLVPTSGNNLAASGVAVLTGNVNGANLQPGTQNTTFSVSGLYSGSGNASSTSTATAVIDPVYSRGSDATSAMQVSQLSFGRVIQGGGYSTGFTVTSNGSHDKYTDLTMNAASVDAADANLSVTVANANPFQFDGTTATSPSVPVSASFSNTVNGPTTGTLVVAGNTGLFTGETLASGTPTLPSLSVSYSATVLEPRQLAPVTGGGTASAITIPTTGGGLLYGAVVPLPNAYSVTSTNANAGDNYATRVIVNGSSTGGTVASVSTADGVTPVGVVTVTQTSTISSGGPQTVAISVQANSFGPTSGMASLGVVTGEDASVNDTTNYSPVSVFYNIANIGYAATGGSVAGNSKSQTFGAPLYAAVPAGTYLAPTPGGYPGLSSLSSLVGATGSTGSNSTTTGFDASTLYYKEAIQVPLTKNDIAGTVGSRCDILSSDVLSNSTTVTMAWRARNADENGSAFLLGTTSNYSKVLPKGVQWLTSDVVSVSGVPSTTGTNVFAYALQMTYDDNINTFTESGGTGTVHNSYIAKLNNSGVWTNAVSLDLTTGSHAQTAVSEDLTTFLTQNLYDATNNPSGFPLDELVGSWGVDLTTHQSWSIIDSGSGDFAVVPEPSTIALVGAAAVGVLMGAFRRRRSAAGVVAAA